MELITQITVSYITSNIIELEGNKIEFIFK